MEPKATTAGGLKAETTERKSVIFKRGCYVRLGDRGKNEAQIWMISFF
jgi:hypothetical protein